MAENNELRQALRSLEAELQETVGQFEQRMAEKKQKQQQPGAPDGSSGSGGEAKEPPMSPSVKVRRSPAFFPFERILTLTQRAD